MDLLRCTVCSWRGSFDAAARAPAVPKSDLPSHMLEIQAAYEEVHRMRAAHGQAVPPPCPFCGHHLRPARPKRISQAS